MSVLLNSDWSVTCERVGKDCSQKGSSVFIHSMSSYVLGKKKNTVSRTKSFILRAFVVRDIYKYQEVVCMKKHNANIH